MKKISIKHTYEQWYAIRTAIVNDLSSAIAIAKAEYSHEDILICALVQQVLQRIEVRLAARKPAFTIGFTFPEAIGLHQAYHKDIIQPNHGTYEYFQIQSIYLTIDKEIF